MVHSEKQTPQDICKPPVLLWIESVAKADWNLEAGNLWCCSDVVTSSGFRDLITRTETNDYFCPQLISWILDQLLDYSQQFSFCQQPFNIKNVLLIKPMQFPPVPTRFAKTTIALLLALHLSPWSLQPETCANDPSCLDPSLILPDCERKTAVVQWSFYSQLLSDVTKPAFDPVAARNSLHSAPCILKCQINSAA